MQNDYDIIIIGCGPVGATLANLLGLGKCRVLVLEREGAVFDQPRAASFDGEAMRVFQTVGLAETILPLVEVAGDIVHVNAAGELLLRIARSPGNGPEGWAAAYRFHQPATEEILCGGLIRFANVQVRRRANAVALDEHDDGVDVRFADLASGRVKQVSARYVVGCDGARLMVRRCMGSPMHDLRSRERWIVLDMVLDERGGDIRHPGTRHASPRDAVQVCDPRRPTTFVPMPGRRYRWEFMLLPGDDPETIATPAEVWRLLGPWNVGPHNATIERAVVYTFHSALAAGWRAGRLMLAGGAAHQIPPFLGQGLCSGLRDVVNLAWKFQAIIANSAEEALLDSYESERSTHVREYIDLAVKLSGIIQATDPETVRRRDIELSCNPSSMRIITPRLGYGLYGNMPIPAGMRAEQPRLGDGRWLDDCTGYRFALLATDELLGELRESERHRLEDGDVVLVSASGEASDYLARLGAAGIMIRPDRALLGVVSSAAELARLIQRYGRISAADAV